MSVTAGVCFGVCSATMEMLLLLIASDAYIYDERKMMMSSALMWPPSLQQPENGPKFTLFNVGVHDLMLH